MASPSFAPQSFQGRRIPLAEIDSLVCARLGPTRGLGNSQPACFNRHVAMYLQRASAAGAQLSLVDSTAGEITLLSAMEFNKLNR